MSIIGYLIDFLDDWLDVLSEPYLAHQDDAGNLIPVYSGNSLRFIVDGEEYFSRVFKALESTKRGDAVLVVGWTFDADMTLSEGGSSLGNILAGQASDGCDVWVVLNGAEGPAGSVFSFSDCWTAVQKLRKLNPRGLATPPLANRVLYDFSGAAIGSHHQKAIVIKSGRYVSAWVGGIDLYPSRRDTPEHRRAFADEAPFGWHDAAIEMQGPATEGVWDNFVSRWMDASTLIENMRPQSLNPSNPVGPPPKPAEFLVEGATSEQRVQVLRSRYPYKYPEIKVRWLDGGGIRQVHATLRKAIRTAKKYIYIEDQYLDNSWAGVSPSVAPEFDLLPELARAQRSREVKVILVTGGRSDSGGETNREVPPEVLQKLVGNYFLAVWRIPRVKVHSKLIFIDDVFCAVGSANLFTRSMWGTDQELHIAIADYRPDGLVREWRSRVWAEHLHSLNGYDLLKDDMYDLDRSLGIWRASWRAYGAGASHMWFRTGNPQGYDPGAGDRGAILEFLGPEPEEPYFPSIP